MESQLPAPNSAQQRLALAGALARHRAALRAALGHPQLLVTICSLFLKVRM